MLKRRKIYCIAFAMTLLAMGYGIAIFQRNHVESVNAVADLWYFHNVLLALDGDDSKAARAAIAYKADQALETIADSDFQVFTADTIAFRSQVLKAYKQFRETHSDLYKFAFDMPPEKRGEWLQRDHALSEFLKSYKE